MSEVGQQPQTHEEVWIELDAIQLRKEYLLQLLRWLDLRQPDANT